MLSILIGFLLFVGLTISLVLCIMSFAKGSTNYKQPPNS